MSFNHRLVKHDQDNSIGIYEVFYDDDGTIDKISDKPIIVGNDLEDLKRELANIQTAFDKSILFMDIIGEVREMEKE